MHIFISSKYNSFLFSIFLFSVFLGVPYTALALCTSSNSNLIFSPVPIQKDAAVGTVIATVTAITNINCEPKESNGEWQVALSSSNSDNGASTLANVRKTNIPGIGILWKNINSATGQMNFMSQSALNDSKTYRGLPSYYEGTYTFTDVFELIKIGPTTSEVLPPFTLAYDYRTKTGHYLGRLMEFSFMNTVITQTACTVRNSSLNVPMGIVLSSVFTGIGSTSTSTDFSISLNCDAKVNPNITINATADSSGTIGVLALDSEENNAVGVGIQILRNGTPMPLNVQSNTSATLTSGVYNILLQARYYQTMSSIIGGSANGTATFTMTYN
ncbi:fimbrial protein [Klebsiella oxytoca]|uniref:fimbrial protein n=1 Tax=Klebsiella oxytoca TaxID=571 RepID=UPI0038790142